MHAAQREEAIMQMLQERGFASFQEIERALEGSPATLRRDLDRMAQAGQLVRIRGGAKLPEQGAATELKAPALSGVPFHKNVGLRREEKAAIGRVAARLCEPGQAIMIDGGSTTLAMCQHLDGLRLQVLTNSLHIVSALLPQTDTQVIVPGGMIFREQDIILTVSGEDNTPRFHAPRLFMGAAALGSQGLMQADYVLVAAERRLIERADEVIVLVDSSKFLGPSGHVVCGLDDIDTVVTDDGIDDVARAMLEVANIRVIIAR